MFSATAVTGVVVNNVDHFVLVLLEGGSFGRWWRDIAAPVVVRLC